MSRGKPAPMDKKPTAIFGGGGILGGVRAQMHLREILMHNQLQMVLAPEVYVTNIWDAFDANNHLKDEKTLAFLTALINNLLDMLPQSEV